MVTCCHQPTTCTGELVGAQSGVVNEEQTAQKDLAKCVFCFHRITSHRPAGHQSQHVEKAAVPTPLGQLPQQGGSRSNSPASPLRLLKQLWTGEGGNIGCNLCNSPFGL